MDCFFFFLEVDINSIAKEYLDMMKQHEKKSVQFLNLIASYMSLQGHTYYNKQSIQNIQKNTIYT